MQVPYQIESALQSCLRREQAIKKRLQKIFAIILDLSLGCTPANVSDEKARCISDNGEFYTTPKTDCMYSRSCNAHPRDRFYSRPLRRNMKACPAAYGFYGQLQASLGACRAPNQAV